MQTLQRKTTHPPPASEPAWRCAAARFRLTQTRSDLSTEPETTTFSLYLFQSNARTSFGCAGMVSMDRGAATKPNPGGRPACRQAIKCVCKLVRTCHVKTCRVCIKHSSQVYNTDSRRNHARCLRNLPETSQTLTVQSPEADAKTLGRWGLTTIASKRVFATYARSAFQGMQQE